MILDKLKVIIDADTSGLKSGINQARSEFNKLSGEANSAASQVDSGMSRAASATSQFAKEMQAGAAKFGLAAKEASASIREVEARVGQLSDNSKIRAAQMNYYFSLIKMDNLREEINSSRMELEGLTDEANEAVRAFNEIAKKRASIIKEVYGYVGGDKEAGDKILAQDPLYQETEIPYAEYTEVLNKANDAVESQKQKILELTAQLSQAKEEASQYSEELKKATSGAEQTANEVKKITKEVEKSTTATKKSPLFSGKFFDRVKMMAFYRLIRAIISAITKAVKETIDLLAVYDKKLGGITGYNEKLSELYTNLKKLLTTFGITVASILTTLGPALNYVMQILTYLFERINELFAWIQGKKTYTAVNPDYWQDYADKVKESNSQLKETKKLISGFDELNIFEKNSSIDNPLDESNPLLVEKEVNAWSALQGLWPALLPIIKNLLDLFKKKNGLLGEQTTATELETEAATALSKAFQWAAVGAGALAGALAANKFKLPSFDLQPLTESLANARQKLSDFADSAWNWGQQTVASWSEGWTTVPATVSEYLDKIGDIFPEFVNDIKEQVNVIPGVIKDAFQDAVDIVPEYAKKMSDGFRTFPTTVIKQMTDLVNVFPSFVSSMNDAVVGFVTDTANNFNTWRQTVYATVSAWSAQTITKMQSTLSTVKNNISTWTTQTASNINTWRINVLNTIKLWAADTISKTQNTFTTVKNNLATWSTQTQAQFTTWKTNVLNTITAWGTSIITSTKNTLSTVASNISNWSSVTIANINIWIATTTANIKSWCSTTASNISVAVTSWANSVYSSLQTTAANVGAWVTNTSSNIASWAKNTANNIGSAAQSMVNSIVGWVNNTGQAIYNWAKRALNSISAVISAQQEADGSGYRKSIFSGVSSWVNQTAQNIKSSAIITGAIAAVTGLSLFKFQGSSIPQYAKGGVVTSPTLAMVGEYSGASRNPEIIAPQSIIQETIDSSNGMLADVITQCTRQVIASIENMDMEVSIGDDVIAKSAARGNKNYYKMTGKSMF